MTPALPAVTVAPVTSAGTLLTQSQPGGEGADFGKSSPVGLLLLLVFLIAVVFLVRSMTKHLKRVPASFDGEGDRTGDGATDGDQADSTKSTDGMNSTDGTNAADGTGATDDPGSTGDADRVDATADGAPGGTERPVGDAGEAAASGR
ncbi:hypothetical protein, partial [Saccharomonospora halophila]|uniref:hypothetical protein n=1 Tax=Saccharomonospora halophila TaxID=129922 RepID=UPI00037F8FEE